MGLAPVRGRFETVLRVCVLLGFGLGSCAAWSNARAAERLFQMALIGGGDPAYTDLDYFGAGALQPVRQSILYVDPTAVDLKALDYDWARIAAVLIDEPFWNATRDGDWSNPCWNSSDSRNRRIAAMAARLDVVISTIRKSSKAKTRIWINFSEPEILWMMDPYCPALAIPSSIDIVSIDKYNAPISSLKPYHDWIIAHRTKNQQQLALVPGVFSGSAPAAAYLQGYFDYANQLNAGGRDRPIVWAVAGWPGDNRYHDDIGGWGIYSPQSWLIALVWTAQFRITPP